MQRSLKQFGFYFSIKLFLLISGIFVFASHSFAQVRFNLHYKIESKDSLQILKSFPLQSAYTNELTLQKELNKWLNNVQALGYLSTSIDSFNHTTDGINLKIFIGKKYTWSNLKWSYKNVDWIKETGIEIDDYKGKTVSLKKWFNTAEQVLRYAENNGYPFCELHLDSIKINQDSIAAIISIDKHLKVTIDSIHYKYTNVVNKKFLYHYLGIKPGMLYNEQAVQKINSLLGNLSFLKQQQPLSIAFIGEHASINLFLQPQNSNKFDFLVALQPSNTNPTPTNPTVTTRYLLSGEGNLHLENILLAANALDMSFRLYPQQTQQLILKYLHPYFLNTAYGIDGKFEVYKHDSTYTDVDFNFGIQHLFSANNYVKIFYNTHSSIINWVDTNLIKATHQLPATLDYKYQTIGVELNQERLDYRFNPSKGYTFKITLAAGFKQFYANNEVTQLHDDAGAGFNFSTLYDSILKPSLHSSYTIVIANYTPLLKRNVLKIALNGGGSPDKKIYSNELIRIGGSRLLRGFDEQSILTSLYAVGTIEYRLLFDKNSFAYAFYDQAYTEIKSVNLTQYDHPYGFGVGIALGTKAGIFQLSYALGSQLNNPIIIKNGKIHFGLLVSF